MGGTKAKKKSKGKVQRENGSTPVYWKKLLAGAIAVGATIGTGFLAATTDLVKEHIKPLLASASCAGSEFFARNTAPYHLTVLILPFENDPNSQVSDRISNEISKRFNSNNIRPCVKIGIPSTGDYEENVKTAKASVQAIVTKYDADLVVFGTVVTGNDKSRIIVTPRHYIDYLYSSGIRYYDDFDAANPELFVRSQEFQRYVIEAMNQLATDVGCHSPVFRVCSPDARLMPKYDVPVRSDRLADYFRRIESVWTLFMNSNLLDYDPISQNTFNTVTNQLSALGMHLFLLNGVQELADSKGELQPTLNLADNVEMTGSVFRNGKKRMMQGGEDVGTAVQRAQIALEAATSCGDSDEAYSATKRFANFLAEYSKIPDDSIYKREFELTAMVSRLGVVRAAAILKARGDKHFEDRDIQDLLKAQGESAIKVAAYSQDDFKMYLLFNTMVPKNIEEVFSEYMIESAKLYASIESSTPSDLVVRLKIKTDASKKGVPCNLFPPYLSEIGR